MALNVDDVNAKHNLGMFIKKEYVVSKLADRYVGNLEIECWQGSKATKRTLISALYFPIPW